MSKVEITQSSGDVFADLNVSRTPSKDRAEGWKRFRPEAVELYSVQCGMHDLCEGPGPCHCRDSIAIALATSFAEGMKRAAEIAECVSDEKDVMALSGCTDSQVCIYREGERAANQIATAILAEIEGR